MRKNISAAFTRVQAGEFEENHPVNEFVRLSPIQSLI